MAESLDTWFKREVLEHEGILVRFIARVWPRRDEVADLRQEAYARVYEAARQSRPQNPKAFLFATVRHLMTDRIRRERIVSIRAGGESEDLNVLIEEITPERNVGAHQELARLAWAFDLLPARCREVLWLRRVKELSQKEVAERLGLAEKTVEKHLATALRKLADHMREHVPGSENGVRNHGETDEGAHLEHDQHE
jgi:RNA polymerase sigma-70 factor (ECF subfamily)